MGELFVGFFFFSHKYQEFGVKAQAARKRPPSVPFFLLPIRELQITKRNAMQHREPPR